MKLDTLFENYDLLMDAPNAVPKMRDLILQLAVQGKLVEQDSTDEPASELLKRIKAEKEKLIAEGKIKKQKPLPSITEDEIPYELPQGWEWVRLGEITNYGATNKVEPDNVKDDEVWVLELEDIEKTTSILLKKVRYKDRLFKSTKNMFLSGDVLYGKLRPYLDKVLVADEDGICSTEILPLRSEIINPYYLRYSLKRKDFLEYIDSVVYGMKMPRLGTKDGQVALIPIPPFTEQKRIVAKVDQLMQLCDQLDACQEKASTKYTSLNDAALEKLLSAKTIEEFAEHWQFLCNNFDLIYNDPAHANKLRQAILQLSAQGKLAPQDPNDEPASELLKRIKAEKEKLITEGKIKKTKPLSPIAEDEIPYELPQGWEWVRLGNIVQVSSGDGLTLKNMDTNGTIPVYGGNGITGYHNKHNVNKQTIVIGRVGYHCGSIHLTQERAWVTDNAFITRFPETDIDQDFLIWLLKGTDLKKNENATAQPVISGRKIYPIIIGIPSLAEQKRIVSKVNQLMHRCDELETRLNQSKNDSEMLMQAILHEAFS